MASVATLRRYTQLVETPLHAAHRAFEQVMKDHK